MVIKGALVYSLCIEAHLLRYGSIVDCSAFATFTGSIVSYTTTELLEGPLVVSGGPNMICSIALAGWLTIRQIKPQAYNPTPATIDSTLQ